MEIAKQTQTLKTPLATIGIFASIAEIAIVIGMINAPSAVQVQFAWFAMGYPLVLTLAFFAILYFKPGVLYAPQDYKEEGNFLTSIQAGRSATREEGRITEISEEIGSLRRYLEVLVKKLEPEKSAAIITTESVRLERQMHLLELRKIALVTFLVEDIDLSIEQVVAIIKEAAAPAGLSESIFKLTGDEKKQARVLRLFQSFAKPVSDFSTAKAFIEANKL